MRIGRTLPPAAAPLSFRDLFFGLKGIVAGVQEEERLKQEIKEFFNKKHCFLVSSGKAALTLILLALKEIHPERNQVLMPAFSCYSVPSAIVRAGLQVELCDIDLQTLDYDYAQLEEKLKNPKLLCVLSLHLFGLPANVERLKQIRKDPIVTIVEDAAQAMGGEWQGKKLGTLGDVGFFSLGRGKSLTAVEGGIILTSNDDLGKRLHDQVEFLPRCNVRKIIIQIGYTLALVILLRPTFFWIPSAMPFLRLGETRFDPFFPIIRFSCFQAGLLREWREKLNSFQHLRLENIKFWVNNLSMFSGEMIGNKKKMAYLLRFPLHVKNHDIAVELMEKNSELGLGLAWTYPDAIHGISYFHDQFKGKDFPKSRQATQEFLTLPIHGFLTPSDRKNIIDLLVGP